MKIFEVHGLDGCQITLLEDVPAKTKAELLARESFWINMLRGGCVNQVKPLMTPYESCRKWLASHPGYTRQYYLDNRATIMETVRKWNLEHPNERKELNKKASAVYYEKNRQTK